MLPACAVLAAVALTATPATAGSGHASLGVCEDTTFDFLAALQQTGTAREGADPTTRAEKDPEKYSGGTEVGQKTPGKPTAGVIDVYFHVITKTDGTGAVSDATIAAQNTVLNQTFVGWFGGDDTGFTFRLAGVARTANDAWYEGDRDGTITREYAMKSALKQGDAADLNIHSNSGGGYLEFAYYPSITASNRYGVLDGVVIHYGSLPGGYIPNCTSATRRRTRWATTSGCRTRSSRAASAMATTWTTPRTCRSRRPGVRRARTRAPAAPVSTRSTTTWTTRTTRATRSSPSARRRGCRSSSRTGA